MSFTDTIFVVDDDEAMRDLLRLWLEGAGFQVRDFEGGAEVLAALKVETPDLLLLDLRMPGLSGEQVLARALERSQKLPVVVLTATQELDKAVEVMRMGATDFLSKPIAPERLLATVSLAVKHHRLARRIEELERDPFAEAGEWGITGRSVVMKELFGQIRRVAQADVSVNIQGESGSGKELVARAIHQSSSRTGPFIALNCAAIPETLQESELFGHERGSFTGATRRHHGRFEQAHGGTLFLDEVAELTLQTQAKLLRSLQERRFQRVGGSQDVSSDFRLLSATNEDLRAAVEAGTFRRDLFYRIVVVELRVPPLRERGADIVLLAAHFLQQFGPELAGRVPRLLPSAVEVLNAHRWPGNVRELQNTIQHALISSQGEDIGAAHLEGALFQQAPGDRATGRFTVPPEMTLRELEHIAIEQAMERCGGNISKVASELGIGRATLYRKLRASDKAS